MKKEITLGQPRQQPHWSYSSINTFLSICSLQWAFRYVYGHDPCHTPAALVLGGAFHQALTFAFRKRMDTESTDVSTVTGLFSELLIQSCQVSDPEVKYPEGEDIDSLRVLGVRMLDAFIAGTDPDEKILGVAVPFSVPLVDQAGNELSKPLIGEYDLIAEADHGVTVVDWKTSARRWAEQKVHQELQPTAYLYAWGQRGNNQPARFRYDIVTKAKTPVVQQLETIRHQEHFTRFVEKVKQVERVCRAEAFIPNDQSWACGDCPYGLSCQSWHRERSRSLYHFKLAA